MKDKIIKAPKNKPFKAQILDLVLSHNPDYDVYYLERLPETCGKRSKTIILTIAQVENLKRLVDSCLRDVSK